MKPRQRGETAIWDWRPGILREAGPGTSMSAEEGRIRGSVDRARLIEHVGVLAGPGMEGRENGTVGGERAREYLVAELASLGLRPFFGKSCIQPIQLSPGAAPHGHNIAGVLPATGADPDADCVMILAHYDHLGVGREGVFAGADDNTSAVAAALEVARVIAAAGTERRHDIVIVFPDAEEPPDVRTDSMGSIYLMDHLPISTERVRLSISLDVLANRALGENLFVLGAETCPDTAALVSGIRGDDAAVPTLASVAVIERAPFRPSPGKRFHKADYQSALKHEVPFLFITSGTSPTYHTPLDTPESLDYEKLAGVTRYVTGLVLAAANDASGISDFSGTAVDPTADVTGLLRMLAQVLDHPPAGLRSGMRSTLRADVRRIRKIKTRLKDGEPPRTAQYSTLQAAALHLQHAMARPDKGLVKLLLDRVRRKVSASVLLDRLV